MTKYRARHTALYGRTEWPLERIVAAVKAWMDAGGSGKSNDFPGPPSTALITQRHGWAHVRTLAGYPPERHMKRKRADRISDDEVLQGVVEFLQDPATTRGTADEYEPWAQSTGRAGGTTVRVRFGSWVDAKALAMTYIDSTISA